METSNQCPMCTLEEIIENDTQRECVTCGHEWEVAAVVKDAFGNVLSPGDIVQMIKDKPIKGSSKMLKCGMKSKPIRLVDGDHPISCKMDGLAIGLKPQFVKKVF